jgi:hypothetical protein
MVAQHVNATASIATGLPWLEESFRLVSPLSFFYDKGKTPKFFCFFKRIIYLLEISGFSGLATPGELQKNAASIFI